MSKSNANEKIRKVLSKMDELMSRNGYNNYQERLYRIHKTLLSIERETDCEVSCFSIDGDAVSSANSKQAQLNTSNYLSVSKDYDDKDYIQFEDNGLEKLEIDDLLKFIENELNMNLIECSTLSMSSSGEDEDLEDEKKAANKPSYNIQNKIFKIELRLRAYLKEQTTMELFNQDNFNSFLNDSRVKTPLSKISASKNISPLIVKNFFEDKKVQDAAKKRFSVCEGFQTKLEILDIQNYKCKSSLNKHKNSDHSANDRKDPTFVNSHNISNFSVEVFENQTTPSNNNINFLKRGSIFKERYQFNEADFQVIQEGDNNDCGGNGSFDVNDNI